MAGTSAGGSAVTATSPDESRLLGLTAELRNLIYRFALLEPDQIVIDKNNFKQPALLATCRQIRVEAGPIYYQENRFSIDCTDLDSRAYITFDNHSLHFLSQTTGDETPNVQLQFGYPGSRPVWGNLLRWSKAIHAGQASGMGLQKTAHTVATVVGRIHDIVFECKDLPWHVVERLITHVKEASEEQIAIGWQ